PFFLPLLYRLAFDDDRAASSTTAKRDEIRRARRSQRRQRLHAPYDVLATSELPVRLVVDRAGHVEAHRHQGLRIEADIERAQVPERPDEQERADQRHERERDLRDDERAAEERLRDAVATRSFL